MSPEITRAVREHAQAVRLFDAAIAAIEESAWHRPRGRRWTHAEEAAHVLLAYDFGARAAAGTMSMRVTRPGWVSAVTRHVLLPLLLHRGAFPSGGVAPAELDPRQRRAYEPHVQTTASTRLTLERSSQDALQAFVHAAEHQPDRRIVHAYFGGLSLVPGWRLLSAHTRHHAITMRAAS